MLSDWKTKVGAAAKAAAPSEPPRVIIPDGAGLASGELIAVQCVITWRVNRKTGNGRVAGCAVNECGSAFHRIEVARITTPENVSEEGTEADLAFRRRIGTVEEDRIYRPRTRISILMRRVCPTPLNDMRPWLQSYNEVAKALSWATSESVKFKGEQFALLLVCSTTGSRIVEPKNTLYGAYEERQIEGVFAAEVIRLAAPAEPSVGDDDEEADDLEGYTWGK